MRDGNAQRGGTSKGCRRKDVGRKVGKKITLNFCADIVGKILEWDAWKFFFGTSFRVTIFPNQRNAITHCNAGIIYLVYKYSALCMAFMQIKKEMHK